ncbi:MAG: asparagine synthase (glutamine-hydrolyzing) [Phycisphaerales bacterium]
MCGVLAIASRVESGVPEVCDARVSAALHRLGPRGPDGSGVWRSDRGDALLAHTRLSIVDLSARGAQPMRDAQRGLTISYNGEIYNARELRSALERLGERFDSACDTEVLLRAIGVWGVADALERVRGMFAFIVWDERSKTLHAAVDHAGIKPLVWCERGGRITLASDLDVLRQASDVSFEMNPDALADVLCRGHVAGPETVWKGVYRLAPGRVLRWSAEQGVYISRWWEAPRVMAAEPLTAEECATLIQCTVAAHLVADVPVGLLLSSGIDSTAIAWACSVAERRDVRCFTLAMGEGHDESPAAARHAHALGLTHERIELAAPQFDDLLDRVGRAFDEPQAYGALLTMTAISQAVRRESKVVLSGDGGDELFGGYTWHHDPPGWTLTTREQAVDDVWDLSPGDRWRLLERLRTSSFGAGYQQAVLPRFHPLEVRALLSPLGCTYDSEAYVRAVEDVDVPDLPWPRRAQRIDLERFCAGSVLAKVDRASMFCGLEVRVPLLDRDLLERCLSAPVDPRLPGKGVIREMLRPSLPSGAVDRPKQGFSLRLMDEGHWDRQRERLRDSAIVSDGVIDPRWERLVEQNAPYRDGRTLALVLLDAWYARRS